MRRLSLWRDYRLITLGIAASYALIGIEVSAAVITLPIAIVEFGVGTIAGLILSVFAVTCILGMSLASILASRLPLALVQGVAVCAISVGLATTASAHSIWLIAIGRGVEGIGAGIALVSMYIAVASMIPLPLRPRMFAIVASSWVVPTLIGPAVAGILISLAGWRFPFVLVGLLNLLNGAVVVAILRGKTRDRGQVARLQTLIWALMAAAALLILQWMWRADGPWAISAAGSAMAAVLLVFSAKRLLPQQTLTARPGLPGLVATRALAAGVIVLAEAWISLHLIRERSVSPTIAGLVISAGALGWLVGSVSQTFIASTRPETRKKAVVLGAWMLGASLPLVVALAVLPSPSLGLIAAMWFFSGLGGGLAVTSISVLVFGPYLHTDYPSPAAALQTGEALATAGLMTLAAVIFQLVGDSANEPLAFRVVLLSLPAVAALSIWTAIRAVRGVMQRDPVVVTSSVPRTEAR